MVYNRYYSELEVINMQKILVVVDMQNDFIDGALGSAEAQAIVPAVCRKIEKNGFDKIIVTYDTHYSDYMDTLEGKKLPVPHCIEGTQGHKLSCAVEKALAEKEYIRVIKNTFGSFDIVKMMKKEADKDFEFEIIGLCTDICVVSNALIIRAGFPDAKITVDSSCCAGVSVKTHESALDTMRCCQIDVI